MFILKGFLLVYGNTVKLETLALLNLAKPDSQNFDKRNVDEMLT